MVLVGVALLTLTGVALAQDDGTVVGEGFDGPMGVLVDPNGDVWVIDSGMGGDEVIQAHAPDVGWITATVGSSSRVAVISMDDGSITDIATLPSVGSPELGASGGSRLAIVGDRLFATTGDWHAMDEPEREAPTGISTVQEILPDGSTSVIFDAAAYERDNNPDETIYYNSHPYDLAAGPDGMLWVVDAAGNDLYTLDPETGDVTLVAVFGPEPGVFPAPQYDNEMLTDSVPTGIAFIDDVPYVSLLPGAPFVPGSSKVVMVSEDGTYSDYAVGLLMITDLVTGPDGNLYGTSFGMFGEQGPVPGSGSLVRIGEGDTSVVIVPGLTFATGVDFDVDGNAYVTVNGLGAPGSGQVLRFDAAVDLEGVPVGEYLASMAPPPPAVDAAAEAPAVDEEVMAAVSDVLDAALAAWTEGDTETLDALTGEEMLWIDTAGNILDRDGWLMAAAGGEGFEMESMSASDLIVRELSPTLLLVTFALHGEGMVGEESFTFHEVDTLLLEDSGDSWKIIFNQGSPVEESIEGGDEAMAPEEEAMIPEDEALAARIAETTSAAPAAIGAGATVLDMNEAGEMSVVLREGDNGFTCMPDDPATDEVDPYCMDAEWLNLITAFFSGEEAQVGGLGVAYLLGGTTMGSITDPQAMAPVEGEAPIAIPPSVFLIAPDGFDSSVFSTDPDSGGPFIVFDGTSMEALVVPVTPASAEELADLDEVVASAMSAAPAAVAMGASVLAPNADGEMDLLVEGDNGWTCIPDNPDTPVPDPNCMDEEWMKYVMSDDPEIERLGISYMLQAGYMASSTDPMAMEPAEGEAWVVDGPHLMILMPGGFDEESFPAGPNLGLPYIMWSGTPFEMLKIPVGEAPVLEQ
jgi:hypothetical protein